MAIEELLYKHILNYNTTLKIIYPQGVYKDMGKGIKYDI